MGIEEDAVVGATEELRPEEGLHVVPLLSE
jgi:hypothetical protein